MEKINFASQKGIVGLYLSPSSSAPFLLVLDDKALFERVSKYGFVSRSMSRRFCTYCVGFTFRDLFYALVHDKVFCRRLTGVSDLFDISDYNLRYLNPAISHYFYPLDIGFTVSK